MTSKQKFENYYRLLVEWNEKFNLTTVTEREKVELLHFKDSILCEDLLKKNATVLDVGSGAGFPGIPLKIVREDLDITLVDSVNKKIVFLNEVIKNLGLEGIRAIHTRVEDIKNKSFDIVTSRAVAPMNVLTEYCLPFVKVGGKMIAYKAANAEEEIKEAEKAIRLLGGEKATIEKRMLNNDIIRSYVIVKKIKENPCGYPRGGNKPRSKPIV